MKTIEVNINTFNALKSFGYNARKIQRKNNRLIVLIKKNLHRLDVSDYLEFKRITNL